MDIKTHYAFASGGPAVAGTLNFMEAPVVCVPATVAGTVATCN